MSICVKYKGLYLCGFFLLLFFREFFVLCCKVSRICWWSHPYHLNIAWPFARMLYTTEWLRIIGGGTLAANRGYGRRWSGQIYGLWGRATRRSRSSTLSLRARSRLGRHLAQNRPLCLSRSTKWPTTHAKTPIHASLTHSTPRRYSNVSRPVSAYH